MSVRRFDFDFDPLYRVAALPFGITPSNAVVLIDDADQTLQARFGPWRTGTTLQNIVDAQVTGPFARIKTIGSARLSFSDRGLTFATNARRAVCLCFAEPVPGLEPTGRLRHPNLTLTVTEPAELIAAIRTMRSAGR